MGLQEITNEKRIYLTVNQGNFVKRVPEGTEKAVEREIEFENKKRMIWELRYKSISAMISSIEVKEGEKFGDVLLINMQDADEHFTISLNLKTSREAKSFMMCLPNIDFSKEITLEPYNYTSKKDGKLKIGMGIKYAGEKENIPYYYTTENGLERLEQGIDKDEFKLAMDKQIIFLKKATKKYINDKMLPEKSSGKLEPNTQATDDFPSEPPSDNELGF